MYALTFGHIYYHLDTHGRLGERKMLKEQPCLTSVTKLLQEKKTYLLAYKPVKQESDLLITSMITD